MARDVELTALYEALLQPFPAGLAGEEINGVDLVLLDEAIVGVASHYRNNSQSLTTEHRAVLVAALADWDAIWGGLPTDEARESFGRLRAIASYMLERR